MASIRRMLVACALLSMLPVASAQVELYELQGSSLGDQFGSTLAALGDLDGDGLSDFAVGAGRDDLHGNNAGRVVICSGATGATLLELHGDAQDQFGRSVARVFDMNGDGFGDVLVGAPGFDAGTGRAYVYGLPTGTLLQTKYWDYDEGFGDEVAGLGDITGDGVPDYGVGTAVTDVFGPYYPGCFYIYSGAGGSVSLTSCAASVHDSVGDVNGDGLVDFLDSDQGLFMTIPYGVQVRSGVDFDVLDQISVDDFFSSVSGFPARDFDGDGNGEYLFTYQGPATKRVAQVRKLPQGGGPPEVLFSIVVADAQFPGVESIQRACCLDVSGDGTPDVLLGFPKANHAGSIDAGSLLAFDGVAPHGLLFRLDGEVAQGGFPEAIIALGDLDGDRGEEFAAGIRGTSSEPGAVRVYTWKRWQLAWQEYGSPLEGSTVPHLAGVGLPAPRSTVTLVADSAKPASVSVMVVGLASQLQLFKGGFLLATPDLTLGPFMIDAAGGLSLSGAVPSTAPPGLQLHFQLWIQDPNTPAGWAATNGLQVTIAD